MDGYKRAVELARQMAPAEQVLFAIRCADAVFAPKYRNKVSYLVHWRDFLASPFEGSGAETVMLAFPRHDCSDEYVAAQRAGAAAWRLQRGDDEQACGLADWSLEHTFLADAGRGLVDLEVLALDVRSRAGAA